MMALIRRGSFGEFGGAFGEDDDRLGMTGEWGSFGENLKRLGISATEMGSAAGGDEAEGGDDFQTSWIPN